MVGCDGGVLPVATPVLWLDGRLHLNKPDVGMAATPDRKGYWFVASDGGIFAYGDAEFYGSTGSMHLNKPIVGMAATPAGLLAGRLRRRSSPTATPVLRLDGSLHLNQPVVGMAATPDGSGYWFAASDGGIFDYGDAGATARPEAFRSNGPIVGLASAPDGSGYWSTPRTAGCSTTAPPLDGRLGGSGITDAAGISLGT